jgi:hypothetical protein
MRAAGLVRLPTVACTVAVAALLSGCGYSRTPVPSVNSSVIPMQFTEEAFSRVGVVILVPRGWTETVSPLPLAATLNSGPAVIALWRYTRKAPPPSDRLALADARRALISAARARDPGLKVIRTKLTRIARAPAVVLDAFERINGRSRRVRSLHIYVHGAEIVIEEYAPPSQFHAVDHDAFSPLNHAIRLRRGVIP